LFAELVRALLEENSGDSPKAFAERLRAAQAEDKDGNPKEFVERHYSSAGGRISHGRCIPSANPRLHYP